MKLAKKIQNRLIYGEELLAAAEEHRTRVVDALFEHYTPFESELKKLHIRTQLDAAIGWFTDAQKALRDASQERAVAQSGVIAVRDAITKGSANLSALIAQARAKVANSMGPGGVKLYGLDGRTPRTSDQLADVVERSLYLMKQNPRTVKGPFGGDVDSAVIADAIEKALEPLRKSLGAMNVETVQLDEAKITLHRAIDTWHHRATIFAAQFELWLRICDLNQEADRLRPTSRRVSGRAQVAKAAAPASTQENPA